MSPGIAGHHSNLHSNMLCVTFHGSNKRLAVCAARLMCVPSDPRYSDIEIMSNEMVISSQIAPSSEEKLNWCKIRRGKDLTSASVLNMSSSEIVVDEIVLQKEQSAVIKTGSILIPGSDREGYLNYYLEILPTDENRQSLLQIPFDVEHAKCSICLNIWHDVVTVAPCLHNFCNGCFSEWLKQSQMKVQNVICPQCRTILHSVGKNHFLRNVAEAILQTDSALLRSSDELAILDAHAYVKSSVVIGSKRRSSARKRPLSPPSVGSSELQLACSQCESELGGFRCDMTTVHLQCHACGGMMPCRPGISIPQHCAGCDRVFCAAYWRNHDAGPSGFYAVCNWETFTPICDRQISSVPDSAHQNNRYEKEITERCIQHCGKTLKDVISEWFSKFLNQEIDQTRLPLNNVQTISSGTHLCNECYDKLVSYLLYWFRISVPKYLMPPDAAARDDCWYGYACRTQHHSDEHARKRNHVCRPTRGHNLGL